jgi:hypothetical protein
LRGACVTLDRFDNFGFGLTTKDTLYLDEQRRKQQELHWRKHMMRASSIPLMIAAGQMACVAAVAQAASTPEKPFDLTAPPLARTQLNTSLVENAKTRRERRAECEAQAEKLLAGEKKKFMKECVANKS